MFLNLRGFIIYVNSEMIWVLASLIFGYLVGAIIVFILLEPESKKSVERIALYKRDFDSTANDIRKKFELLEKSIHSGFTTIEAKINALTLVYKENRKPNEEIYTKENKKTRKENKPELVVASKESVFYFSVPTYQGVFYQNQAKKEFSDGENYYKIVVDNKNPSLGNLFYISNNRDKKALYRIDSFILPVCFIENIDDVHKANSIHCIAPGKVTLSDNQWSIHQNNMVRIKFV